MGSYLEAVSRLSKPGWHPCLSAFLQVTAHVGDAELEGALKGADLVVIPAGELVMLSLRLGRNLSWFSITQGANSMPPRSGQGCILG